MQDSSESDADIEVKKLVHKAKQLAHEEKRLAQAIEKDRDDLRASNIHDKHLSVRKREGKTQRAMTKILTRAAKPSPIKPKPKRRLKNKRFLVTSVAGVPVEGIEDEYKDFV